MVTQIPPALVMKGVLVAAGGVPSTGADASPVDGILSEPGADVVPLMHPSEPDVGTTSLVLDADDVSSCSSPVMSKPWSVTIENGVALC